MERVAFSPLASGGRSLPLPSPRTTLYTFSYMIIRMYPTDGLKGQQTHSPGYSRQATFALQGQKRYIWVSPKVIAYEGDDLYRLLPLRGVFAARLSPGRCPGLCVCWSFRPSVGYMRIIIKKIQSVRLTLFRPQRGLRSVTEGTTLGSTLGEYSGSDIDPEGVAHLLLEGHTFSVLFPLPQIVYSFRTEQRCVCYSNRITVAWLLSMPGIVMPIPAPI